MNAASDAGSAPTHAPSTPRKPRAPRKSASPHEPSAPSRKVLVLDVGGTHVKFMVTGQTQRRRFDSSPDMTAAQMVDKVKAMTEDWSYDVVAIGYPGAVLHGRIATEPHNLGDGWVGFDFEAAMGCPVRIVNDAAMQALGSYEGGRMLFLGLGTGLGSAMIVDGVLEPMELAHLPYKKGRTFEDYIGASGLKRHGKKRWRKDVWHVVDKLRAALEPDTVVIGGGNADKLKDVPNDVRLVDNDNAFSGGVRLWKRQGGE